MLPPVRNRVDIVKSLEAGKKAPKKRDPRDIFTEATMTEEEKRAAAIKRDTTPMPDYYKAWDKFDVDKALDSDEDESGIKYRAPEEPQSQADMMKLTSGARPNTKIVIKGGT